MDRQSERQRPTPTPAQVSIYFHNCLAKLYIMHWSSKRNSRGDGKIVSTWKAFSFPSNMRSPTFSTTFTARRGISPFFLPSFCTHIHHSLRLVSLVLILCLHLMEHRWQNLTTHTHTHTHTHTNTHTHTHTHTHTFMVSWYIRIAI